MRKLIDIQCDGCKVIQHDQYVDVDVMDSCACGGTFARVLLPGNTGAVIGDDIPGGLEIKHGICNEDGSPKRYYSKTEIRRAAAAKGLTWGYDTNKHVPTPGSDKNKFGHTAKW